jgi:hypothetical protein
MTYAGTVNESDPVMFCSTSGAESWGCFVRYFSLGTPDRRESRVDQAARLLRLIVAPCQIA